MSLLVHIPTTRFKKIMYDCVVKELFPILDQKCRNTTSDYRSGGSGHVQHQDENEDSDSNKWYMDDELEYFAFNAIYDYNVGKTIGINDPFFVEYKNLLKELTGIRIKSMILKYVPFIYNSRWCNILL